jgi:hypothetical protein
VGQIAEHDDDESHRVEEPAEEVLEQHAAEQVAEAVPEQPREEALEPGERDGQDGHFVEEGASGEQGEEAAAELEAMADAEGTPQAGGDVETERGDDGVGFDDQVRVTAGVVRSGAVGQRSDGCGGCR